jgi:hypothetical protein
MPKENARKLHTYYIAYISMQPHQKIAMLNIFLFVICRWYAGFLCPDADSHRKSIHELNFGMTAGKVLELIALLTKQILGCLSKQ